jgi:hypothetical protein
MRTITHLSLFLFLLSFSSTALGHSNYASLSAAFGIFSTPVDMNTWCNQRHNVPFVFPETQQSDNFVPAPGIVATHFNFGPAVLGTTTVSFAAFEAKAPPQYIEQWSGSVEKSLGGETTLELGYLGSHGVHLQRSHLTNNAPPGPGAIGPRRPFRTLSFLPGMVLPDNITIASTTFPVSGINLLENSAQSWYHAGSTPRRDFPVMFAGLRSARFTIYLHWEKQALHMQ